MHVGIDVSKAHLEVMATTWKKSERYANSSKGIKSLTARLGKENPELVVLESTGGYERNIAKELQAAGIKKAVVNPWQTHNFARGLGLRAKTDPIDSEMLARFGEAVKPRQTEVPTEQEYELQQLVMRRIQLVQQKTQELNRLQQADAATIKRSIRAVLKALRAQIKAISSQIKTQVNKSEIWKEKAQILQSAKGIGEIIAFSFCALLPELGKLNRKQIGALVGVVPYNHDSGRLKGQRCISGGRAEVRSLLYMAALTAIRCNDKIKSFYKHLLPANRLKKKVAIVACMRKLLVCLNAMCKTGQAWKFP